jgi:uncharacterized protein
VTTRPDPLRFARQYPWSQASRGHTAAENWFAGLDGNFATCPVTQGSLLRLLIREGQPAATARAILAGTTAHPQHEFWPDDLP